MESCGRGPLKWPCLHQIDFQCYSESSACAIVGCPDSSNPSKETNLSQPIFYLHTLVTIMSKIQIGLDARSLKVPIEPTTTHTILRWADLRIINAFTLSIKSQIWKGPLFPHRVKPSWMQWCTSTCQGASPSSAYNTQFFARATH